MNISNVYTFFLIMFMKKLKSTATSFSLSRTFASLKYPNFRIWFVGQMISLFGTWMQTTALAFYVFDLTGSKALLGVVAFATGLPTILFMVLGGFVADRLPRRSLLIATQSSMMIFAFVFALLTFTGHVEVWHIIVFAILNGIATAFDAPARQSFLLEMVDRKALTNAIALNSMMFNSATALGPAIGGVIYALVGPGWCFAINGVSFLAVIIALFSMKLRPVQAIVSDAPAFRDIADGVREAFGDRMILLLMTIIAFASFFGFSLFTLFPAWAVNMLGGDSKTNGFLQSARGIGAFVSAIIIASIGNSRHRGKLLRSGTLAFPAALLVFAFITNEVASLVFVFLAGVGMMFVFNLANAMVQSSVSDNYRGRVMGIYSLVFFGFSAIGSLAAGFFAEIVGAQAVMVFASIVLVLFSVMVFRLAKTAGVKLLVK
jgi:MFS family permease